MAGFRGSKNGAYSFPNWYKEKLSPYGVLVFGGSFGRSGKAFLFTNHTSRDNFIRRGKSKKAFTSYKIFTLY